MRIVNSTVARNLAEDNPDLPEQGAWYDRGGGIYMGGGSLSIVSSTVAENAVRGVAAIISGKPNLGGGGIAATIGNAHTVENVTLQDSIVAGNTLNGASEDWFPGSILDFRSRGYNLVGRVDFSQILVPVPAWSMLSRKRWPKAGDVDGVAIADALDVAGARLHGSVLSAGTDAGKRALLWYPPGPRAVNRIPRGERQLTYVDAGYEGAGAATDDFLNHVIVQLRQQYGDVLGAQFGEELGDLTGTTWVLDPVTWPSNPQNKDWIAFWRNLDVAIGDKLGMAGLGDQFWGTFQSGPLCPWVKMTVMQVTESALPEATDQTGRARPGGQVDLGDIGAIEK
jgi:hypothetical protein